MQNHQPRENNLLNGNNSDAPSDTNFGDPLAHWIRLNVGDNAWLPKAMVERIAGFRTAAIHSGQTKATLVTDKNVALEQLKAKYAQCSACVLAAGRKNIVFGEGDAQAKLLFVGEGPGENEDIQGRPFVGKAGELLTKMIGAMGFTREQIYIANAVKCRPPGNRTPSSEEIAICLPILKEQIEIIEPTMIVALGATAVKALLGDSYSITRCRGKFVDYHLVSTYGARVIPVMPTYHPAYLLRNPEAKADVWQDLKLVMKTLSDAK